MQLKLITAIIVLMVVVASLLVAGCINSNDNTTSSGSNKKDVSSGLVISAKAVSPSPQSMGGVKPKSGNVFVVYDCTVKNTGAEGVDLIAYYWHLRGTSGYYDAIDKLPVQAPEFSYIKNSHVGDVASGYVYFEVPSNASNAWTSLRFTNLGFASVLSNQTFDLSVNV